MFEEPKGQRACSPAQLRVLKLLLFGHEVSVLYGGERPGASVSQPKHFTEVYARLRVPPEYRGQMELPDTPFRLDVQAVSALVDKGCLAFRPRLMREDRTLPSTTELMLTPEATPYIRGKLDAVVTVPKDFGLREWVAEGDPAGAEWSGETWHFYLGGNPPVMVPGERVYVVNNNRVRGYAPLVRVERDGERRFSLVRQGGARAVTIDEQVRGFQGWRWRWWDRKLEMEFPDWRAE